MGFCLNFILVGQVQLPFEKALYAQKPPLIVNRAFSHAEGLARGQAPRRP